MSHTLLLANNNTDGFSQIYQQHQPWLYQWLWKKLGCCHYAADFAQEAFIKVLTQKNTDTLAEPRAYLKVVARNALVDHWRKKELEQAYLKLLSQQEHVFAPSEEHRLEVFELLEQLDKRLYRLPVITRQVFLLSQLNHFTYQQIAEQLDISVMSVRRYMKHAIMVCAGLIEA